MAKSGLPSTQGDPPNNLGVGGPVVIATPDWVDALREPGAYPDRPSNVELIETHISWVYLTDGYVYKIKKPVKFTFLDFSTLERRRVDCEAEVSLNQHLAPRVYCGVVPIVRTQAGRIRVECKGRLVEWAVKMHRLPAEQSLDHLLRDRELTSKELLQLGTVLANFYNRLAPVSIATTKYCERVERHVVENRAELLKAEHGLESSSVLRTHSAQLATLRIFADLLENRVRDGRVVEGHGDLRPEHIYMMQPPVAIDCIEFNRELREIDVLDELGFLAMECDRLGAARVGARLLEIYAESSGDHADPRLLRFYKSYRASVRAKVHVLRARQLEDRAARASIAEARDYVRLADRYAETLMPPMLLIVSGISGSGKSTLATRLGEDLGIEVLRSDVVRDQVAARLPARNEADLGRYSSESRDQTYRELLRGAEARLATGVSVIVDGTFMKRSWREQALEIASRDRASAWIVKCDCPVDVASQRIAQRTDSPSEAWPDLAKLQSESFDEDFSNEPCLLVDSTECLPKQASMVYQGIRNSLSAAGLQAL